MIFFICMLGITLMVFFYSPENRRWQWNARPGDKD